MGRFYWERCGEGVSVINTKTEGSDPYDIPTILSSIDGGLSAKDVILLAGEEKPSGSKWVYLFNQSSLWLFRTFQLVSEDGGTSTLNGFRYFLDASMPGIESGECPIGFVKFPNDLIIKSGQEIHPEEMIFLKIR